jgi:hypothetical protein
MAKKECQPIRDAITACTNAIPLLKAAEAKCENGQRLEALQQAQIALAMVDCAAESVDIAYQEAMMAELQSGAPPMPMDLDLDMGAP